MTDRWTKEQMQQNLSQAQLAFDNAIASLRDYFDVKSVSDVRISINAYHVVAELVYGNVIDIELVNSVELNLYPEYIESGELIISGYFHFPDSMGDGGSIVLTYSEYKWTASDSD